MSAIGAAADAGDLILGVRAVMLVTLLTWL
jgi:hypothetical protein